MRAALALAACSLALPAVAHAQPAPERAIDTSVNVGVASTYDDEGLLGRGTNVSGAVAYRLTPRLTLGLRVDRIPYYRDVEWLTFDGRAIFAGVEGIFQSRHPRVRPYITFGYGVLRNDGTWVQKRVLGPGLSRVEDRVSLEGTFGSVTVSGGLDVPVGARTSIRTSLRIYAVEGRVDIDPFTIITPQVGVAHRW
jgi:hypothetical protein